jgi:hypothetical protein
MFLGGLIQRMLQMLLRTTEIIERLEAHSGSYIEHDSGTYRLKFADGTDMESNEHGQTYPARPSSQQMDDLMDSGRLKPDGHRYKLKNAPRR